MKVVIDKAKLFNSIRINVEYIASRAEYEKMSIIDEDIELFNGFYGETIATISSSLDRFVEEANNAGTKICFIFNAPYFDDTKLEKLRDNIFKVLQYDSIFKWLLIVAPATATTYNEMAKQALIEVSSLIYKRLL